MPGVPSSRACDACMKQKKKCDQTQPACSRCKRLCIQCTGCGVRRYIFKTQSTGFKGKSKRATEIPVSRRNSVYVSQISRMPCNALSSLTALVVNRLQVKDLRHNLKWAYGPFLDDIPVRLGRNNALDTATRALFMAASGELSNESLLNYTRALQATRMAILESKEALTADTMCAIYFLWLLQRQSDESSRSSLHVAAIAQILNHGNEFQFDQSFDRGLVYTVCSIVASERALNHQITLMNTSVCWRFFGNCLSSPTPCGPCHPVVDEFELTRQLASFLCLQPDLLEHGRCVSEVKAHYRNLQSVVQLFKIRYTNSRTTLHTATKATSIEGSEALDQTHSFLQDLRSYGLSLTLAATFNTVLRVYDPQNMLFVKDLKSITKAIVAVAHEAGKFEPIGAGFVSPFLDTAWAVDASSRPSILAVAGSHQLGFTVGRATIFAAKFQQVLSRLRESLVLRSGEPWLGD